MFSNTTQTNLLSLLTVLPSCLIVGYRAAQLDRAEQAISGIVLAEKKLEISQDGLIFAASSIAPIAFGIVDLSDNAKIICSGLIATAGCAMSYFESKKLDAQERQ